MWSVMGEVDGRFHGALSMRGMRGWDEWIWQWDAADASSVFVMSLTDVAMFPSFLITSISSFSPVSLAHLFLHLTILWRSLFLGHLGRERTFVKVVGGRHVSALIQSWRLPSRGRTPSHHTGHTL